jgi:hypothetical protein
MALVKLQCENLLNLYDVHQDEGNLATAVSSVAGEELGLSLFEHYLLTNGVAAKRVDGPCTTGKAKGYRLDGWIDADAVLYQVEVKNWGSVK